jgi:hypothetical protein
MIKDDPGRFIRMIHGLTGSRKKILTRHAAKSMKNSCLAGLAT